jgi:hypothetical protein
MSALQWPPTDGHLVGHLTALSDWPAIALSSPKAAKRRPARAGIGDVLSKEEIWQATAYVMSLSQAAK